MESSPFDRKMDEIESQLEELDRRKMEEALTPILEFDKTPEEFKKYLDDYIIGQEDGKKILATYISYHFKRLSNSLKMEMENNGHNIEEALKNTSNPKTNILIIGPSGVGKTETARRSSDAIKAPFIKEDLTKFSETGYVGRQLDEILLDLLVAAKGNYYLAQMGIVYLDEIDKVAGARVIGRDVSGTGVQNCLLTLTDGIENTFNIHGMPITISTEHVLFIAAGSFEGSPNSPSLKKIVERRLKRYGIRDKDWTESLLTEDLITYGMSRQLMGRFPVRVFYRELTREDLVKIMTDCKESPLKAYKKDFEVWGIDLEITRDALEEIARYAEKEKIGARGLTAILSKVLKDPMYELPGKYEGEFKIDVDYVKNVLGD